MKEMESAEGPLVDVTPCKTPATLLPRAATFTPRRRPTASEPAYRSLVCGSRDTRFGGAHAREARARDAPSFMIASLRVSNACTKWLRKLRAEGRPVNMPDAGTRHKY